MKTLLDIKKLIIKNKYLVSALVLITIYIVYFTTLSFLRYDNFYTGKYDLGNMDQVVWNTFHGRIFQTFLENSETGKIASRISSHADFILILLAPFYSLWNNPKMLLLLQTVVLGLGGIFIYSTKKAFLN